MSEPLSRERTLELLSDYREGALEPELRAAVARRLASDPECRQTLAALDELAVLLPALVAAAEPGKDLAERAARAALAAFRRAPAPVPAPVLAFRAAGRYRPAVPTHLQAAAAVAMLVTGLGALVSGPEAAPQQAATRLVERTSLELRQQSGRLVENIRQLGELVGAAVETRIDRVEDRVDDYRRLLLEQEQPASESRNGAEATLLVRQLAEPERESLRTDPTSATDEARQHAEGHAPRRRT
jgi:hypothetical protein